jgi:phosphate-selective porin OprO/OprP
VAQHQRLFRGDTLEGLDATGTTTVASDDPGFFSWYAETGYYLTGEARGYKNGMWDRTKVLKPVQQGRLGRPADQRRYDFLDLATRGLRNGFSNNFATGRFTTSTNLGRGGTQAGYLASLIWIPRIMSGSFSNTLEPASRAGPSLRWLSRAPGPSTSATTMRTASRFAGRSTFDRKQLTA